MTKKIRMGLAVAALAVLAFSGAEGKNYTVVSKNQRITAPPEGKALVNPSSSLNTTDQVFFDV